MGASFKNEQVYSVRTEEYDNETHDFGAFFVCALEVPNSVHDVTVETACNEPQKV